MTREPELIEAVAPVFFAADADLTCYFLSDPQTRHGQDIALVGRVAAAIYPDEPDWQRLRGIQLTGSVRLLEEAEPRAHAWTTYAGRFPVVADLSEAVARSGLYALTPDWLRLVDNRRGFGFRREWRLRPR